MGAVAARRTTTTRATRRARRRGGPLAAGLALLLPIGLAGCSAAGTGTADDGPVVVVSTNILGDVVEEIVGSQAEVVTLMKPDADPHSFEISAQEAEMLGNAELVVSNGLGLEEGLQQHLDQAGAAGVPVLAAGDHVETLVYGVEAGDSEGQPDPHFWTDPARMDDAVVAIADALAAVPGVDAARLEEDTAAYRAQLADLDEEMTAAFGRIDEDRKALVTNHHVFAYLAERYGFRVLGAVLPSGTTLAAPSASDLAGLAATIREAGVPTIFADSSQPDRLVQVLAEEAGIDVQVVSLFTESLSETQPGAASYLEMMHTNTERISAGLGAD
ncbi:zinc ABC transporter substrate-binding protein AztC [Mycetocola reblochoni]|uniref:Zinc ABC transporter, periplasmic-binding protein ZnuA n=2 Tax=Mycetocola reblochoni TaxID=331618 RepID=A0A1R4I998_9MICO|nr:zinc ABC transporter substrate-binding protein AztC [Mycetocola reblochoni]RLP69184.1 zinc ABC transporter substrate-binding protein [Mycetocola reblochoni]SJN16407.1 Zinc ABC transporter, periplasmic-binding protein ZnuA [Mycetocola reblochoni REB411]